MTVRALLRRDPEQPHPWFGRLRLGSRLRFGGKIYVLSEVSYGHGLTLQYQELGSWEASHLIDPHADCRRKRRFRRRGGKVAGSGLEEFGTSRGS